LEPPGSLGGFSGHKIAISMRAISIEAGLALVQFDSASAPLCAACRRDA
jgi:hypothetical protein